MKINVQIHIKKIRKNNILVTFYTFIKKLYQIFPFSEGGIKNKIS